MSYVVLARKWRPQTFEDLVGQEHVATTIGNSIAMDRVAHAFLFTGVRGVGKTTSARILAKALNCEKGPTAKPCLVCPACEEIARGVDLDVQEIDAASHTGVDDVRDLQKQLSYLPSRDRFRVYIVDEVHMLSNSAWNAFLKTLEEPPPHVKFIFATTEVTKVPATILSRCQRYDFKMIGAATVAARLKHVLSAEGIAADDGAVAILAREAAGSMRDAMSLLDQVIAWAGADGRLTTEGVARVLGVAESAVLWELASSLVSNDASACLRTVAALADEGYDLGHVARDFLAHLRDLVVGRVAPEAPTLIEASDAEREQLLAIAQRSSVEDLTRLHQGFSKALDDVLRSSAPRASLEMALVRLARRPPMVPIDELLARLGSLEARLSAASGGAARGRAPSGASAGAPRPGPRRDDGDPEPGPSRGDDVAPEGAARDLAAPEIEPRRPPPEPAARPERPVFVAPVFAPPAAVPAAPAAPPPSFKPPPPLTFAVPGGAPPPGGQAEPPPSDRAPARPAGPPPSSRSPLAARAALLAPQLRMADDVVRDADDPRWAKLSAVVEDLRGRNVRLAPLVELAALVSISRAGLAIAIDARSFEGAQLTDPAVRNAIVDASRAVLGPEATLDVFDLPKADAGVPTLARLRTAEARARRAEADRAVREHPLVVAAVEHLGAEIRDVRLPPEHDAGR